MASLKLSVLQPDEISSLGNLYEPLELITMVLEDGLDEKALEETIVVASESQATEAMETSGWSWFKKKE